MYKEFRTKSGGNWWTKVDCKLQYEFVVPGQVSNIIQENVTATSSKIYWTPPLEINGVLNHYDIEYKVHINTYEHMYKLESNREIISVCE